MSVPIKLSGSERKFMVDRLKADRNNHQSEANLFDLQLRKWGSKKIPVGTERIEEYRKMLNHHEECVCNIDRLIAKLHAH
ncbi:hypothetical protein LCGC14_1392680 [marine sediment metagenome]|uniref:Uncharacterized protein n=1 Tax=marine sediment metagenome TaxID=412755 RepID=A0A0F9KKA5_9ZZZZ